MSLEASKKPVDLLVVITRLHAPRGSKEDEFVEEWSLPANRPGKAGATNDQVGLTGIWVLSEISEAGLLVIHGYEGLLENSAESFEKLVLKFLDKTNLEYKKFSRLSIFAHGSITKKGGDLSEMNCPDCSELKKIFTDPMLVGNYTLSTNSAALVVPEVLKNAGISELLLSMVKDCLKLKPPVDRAVRSMQHIILEMRLWCDLYFRKEGEIKVQTESQSQDTNVTFQLIDDQQKIIAKINACITRLKNEAHWENRAVTEVLPGKETLLEFLKKPSSQLFKSASGEGANEDESFLKCPDQKKEAPTHFFENGTLSGFKQKEIDDCLKALSARLETLIIAAARKDERNNPEQGSEGTQ